MKLYPKAPDWHECSKLDHCVHLVPGRGLLCCRCPVRAVAPYMDSLPGCDSKGPSHDGIIDPKRPWALSFDIPHTQQAQDEIRYFRKKMGWPWPCQNGCNRIAESPESYWCDVDPPCQPEKNYVAGVYEKEWPK